VSLCVCVCVCVCLCVCVCVCSLDALLWFTSLLIGHYSQSQHL